MREILFRGKDLQEQNGWLYGYFYKSDINKRERESGKATLIFTPNCDTFIYCPEYHNSWMVKAETVGQYTGLCDKNGTRVFENDIVTVYYNPKYVGVSKDRVGNFAVVFHDGCFMKRKITNPMSGDAGLYHFIQSDEFEVIGNIYDNPELLEGKGWRK